VRISLAPHQVAMVRFARGLKPRLIDQKRIDCPQAVGVAGSIQPWSGAIDALREVLAHPNVGKAQATVVLSSHFVRYMTVPWSAELVTRDEELAFARSRFAQVFGDAAQGWAVKLSPAPAGNARLAAAVDQTLVERLSSAIASSPLTLTSVQPALMAQFNDWRRPIGDDAWLVVAERGRLLTVWIANGEWRAVRARPINGEMVPLAQILEQERLLLSAGSAPSRVCLAVADDVAVDASGLRVERLGNARSAPAGGGFALAMAGAVS
jgi:hypothetical protein